MPALLACIASVLWGSSDFLGGLSSRRLPTQLVTGIALVAGLGTALVLFAVVGGDPTRQDLLLGAASGVLNCVGLIGLYRALAMGPMSVAAPTTSVMGAGTAVVAGLLGGERFTGLTALGAVAAIVAIVAVSREPEHEGKAERAPGHVRRTLVVALLGGLALGLANVCFAGTAVESGLAPLALARAVAVAVLVGPALRSRPPTAIPRRDAATAASAGATDAIATTAMLLALQRGPLVLVGVLGALYPIMTVVLARVVLREVMGRWQVVGLGFGVAAVALLGLG